MSLLSYAKARRKFASLGYDQDEFPTTWTVNAGVFVQSNSALEDIYWPCIFPAYKYLTSPPARYFLYYSTDHSETGGGIGVAFADSLETGGFTERPGGVIYVDAVNGDQSETPEVWWDPATSKVMLCYQNRLATPVGQGSVLATSSNGLTGWTRQGVIFTSPATLDVLAGGAHQGYARTFPLGRGGRGAMHLQGGGTYSRGGFSYSADNGYTWHTKLRSVPTLVGHGVQGYETEGNNLISRTVVRWRGRYWCVGSLDVTGTPFVAPLRPDFLGFSGPGKVLDVAGRIEPLRSVFSDQGNLYGLLQTNTGSTRNFSVAKAVLA